MAVTGLERTIVWDHEPVSFDEETIGLIGGKARGLHELKGIGSPVPRWATVSSEFFSAVRSRDTVLQSLLLKELPDPSEKAATVREYLANIRFEAGEARLLRRVRDCISRDGKCPVAVRSSAADEDSKILSFAGQMDSFLNTRSYEEFLKAVRGCWMSLFSERAVSYRQRHGLDPWNARFAVVVQEMIQAERAGVIFTANPLNGRMDQMLISCVWGLGEGLVSGQLDADTVVLNACGRVIKCECADKSRRAVYDREGGTCYRDVPRDRRKMLSLTPKLIRRLRKLALRAQKAKQMPLDIEFAAVGNKICILQARPVTGLQEPRTENVNVWDNSNIVESYSGVTTPLTFSFIRRAYYAVYWQFCETIGVGQKAIFRNRHILENMLGLIQGRVYYNLLNWYRLVSLMPGFKYNKRFMEQMMGLQIPASFEPEADPGGFFRKYFVQLPRLIKVGLKMWSAHFTLPKRVAAFHTHFAQVYARYAGLDYGRLSPAQILSVYRLLEDEVLWKWKAPITNDFEAMIFYGVLKSLTRKWDIDPQGTLQNDLLCGEGGIKSTEVSTQLCRLARRIESVESLKTKVVNASPEGALKLIREDSEFANVRTDFYAYLDEYGVRCINEMKLESISVKEDPLFCVSTIQNYLRMGVPDPQQQHRREQNIRREAELVLKKRLKGKRLFFLIPRVWIYRWILKNARGAIRNRENQRFARTQAYSLVRTLIRAIGRQWEEKGILRARDDIFYLELDEIWSYIEGTSTSVNVAALAQLRREEFAAYEDEDPPDHIETSGEVYSGDQFRSDPQVAGAQVLTGLGCCPGVVECQVQVVLSPDPGLSLNGEIMVAKQTDPGWVVLFPSISGLIVEKGSMLSHSAIVAREMGIPAVVGAAHATRILSTGDHVVLNGAEGTVRKVSEDGQR
ncbi:MAG: hypothetical protein GF333_06665 [Candidatus Omnitrophica bacterium]|nr:hypothetical protein [Candidatus Omnitrophota bacterium]